MKMDEDRNEDEKIYLLGSLVSRTQTILSSNSVTIWTEPDTLNQVVSLLIAILSHGYIQNSENKLYVWDFVVGLRVVRPDLWPDCEYSRSSETTSSFELLSKWLKTSLQARCLSEQIWSLVSDRKRVLKYYHEWALLRNKDCIDVILIVVQSLEKNSQHILSSLDPDIMLKYQDLNTDTHLEHDKTHEILLRSSASNTAVATKFYLSESEDDFIAQAPFENSEISPSLLVIDYQTEASEASSPGRDLFKAKGDIPNIGDLSISENLESKSSCSNSTKDISNSTSATVGNVHLYDCDFDEEAVRPSRFLYKYLSEKSKVPKASTSNVNFINSSKLTESQDMFKDLNLSSNKNRVSNASQSSNLTSSPAPDLMLASASGETPNFSSMLQEKSIAENSPNQSKIKKSPKHVRSSSDSGFVIVDRKLRPDQMSDEPFPSPYSVANRKKRFMDDGGLSITPEADGFFPQPQPGQSLLEFLNSTKFTKSCAQLDRENAHFSIAEAVLAAMEQVNHQMISTESRNSRDRGRGRFEVLRPDESEDDLINPRRRHGVRRKPRSRCRQPINEATSDEEPATTDNSIFDSPDPTSSDQSSGVDESPVTTDSNNDKGVDETKPLSEVCSAENVALAILSNYNARLLPSASDLQWLVSEQEVPQKLLPLPTSVPVDPDEVARSDQTLSSRPILLRGTNDWAPPRPQLILTLHKNIRRRSLLEYQKWRCAGCGLSVSEKLSSRFSLCDYLGRFFCTSCHTNKKSVIPARILHEWDFKKYAVCNFSLELIERMSGDPLFDLSTLNPRLYSYSKDLHQTHIYKLQLYHARAYVLSCRKALKEKEGLRTVPSHWYSEPHVYSLDDFISIKKGGPLVHQLKGITTSCITHISKCQVCLGQGFVCEICRNGSPIFAFQLDSVTACPKCGCCFHFSCFSSKSSCPRCLRRKSS